MTLFLAFAYLVWDSGPLELSDRAEAFMLNLSSYDGVDAGALGLSSDWNVVCKTGAYLNVSSIYEPDDTGWRIFDPEEPVTFAEGINDREIPEGYGALVYLKGNQVVDYLMLKGAPRIADTCIESEARFRWHEPDPDAVGSG